MPRHPDHDGRVDDLTRLLEELDCGTVESMEDLDDEVLDELTRKLGTREELERVWDLMRGTADRD